MSTGPLLQMIYDKPSFLLIGTDESPQMELAPTNPISFR